MTLNDTDLTGNTANKGGGVSVNSATLVINGGSVLSNSAVGGGGGLNVEPGTATATGTGVDIGSNTPDDVKTAAGSTSYGGVSSFVCSAVGCF